MKRIAKHSGVNSSIIVNSFRAARYAAREPGAIAHRRILQLRHQYSYSPLLISIQELRADRAQDAARPFSGSQFLISIRFDTLDMNGRLSPLSVRLNRDVKSEKGRTGPRYVGITEVPRSGLVAFVSWESSQTARAQSEAVLA